MSVAKEVSTGATERLIVRAQLIKRDPVSSIPSPDLPSYVSLSE
jgi:hypothetical protein